MSPSLFANTVRSNMTALRTKWEREGRGTVIGSNLFEKERLCYAMFADDTTLIAKSKQALRVMIKDFCEALEKIGLNVNADKCKVQCSKARPFGDRIIQAGERNFPIVDRTEGFTILGTTVTLDGKTCSEFQHRLKAAWGKFHELWPLLGKRDTSVRK